MTDSPRSAGGHPGATLQADGRQPGSHRGARIGREQVKSLVSANLGWFFDGFETYSLILTVAFVLKDLLPAGNQHNIPLYAGATIAITLFGWAIGGLAGGMIADYIGRRRMLLWSIALYAVCTGLTALSWSWVSFAIFRFVTGLALGSEWGTGTSLVAETWSDRTRSKAAGIMQSGLGIGFFIASLAWHFLAPLGPNAWRLMFVLGVLPALVAVLLWRRVPESGEWLAATKRATSGSGASSPGTGSPDAGSPDAGLPGAGRRRRGGLKLRELTLFEVLRDPQLRKVTLIASVMSLVTTVAWWGISTWVPDYVSQVAAEQGRSASAWSSDTGMIYNAGAIVGYIALGFVADLIGRRWTTFLYFALSFALTPLLFLGPKDMALLVPIVIFNGMFTLGQYTWMPVWLPELYPTRLRATGVSFVFNAARFIACLGPLLAGAIITHLGGYGTAATAFGCIYLLGMVFCFFLPETKGKPLPQ
ncbi:MAG TPA: MFS transporter [Trebonia sp.]